MEDDLKKNKKMEDDLNKKMKMEDDLFFFKTRMTTSKKMEDDLKKIMEDNIKINKKRKMT